MKPQVKHRPDEQKSHTRRSYRMRRPLFSTFENCAEGMDVYAAGISVKVGAHYPGRFPCLSPTMASSWDYGDGNVSGRVGRSQPKP